MKKCLQCTQIYGDETNFCLADGSTLVSISDSFTSETPTVFSGAPFPTVPDNSQFTPPVAYPPTAQPKKSQTVLIALLVGFFALVGGGAIVGLVIYGLSNADKKVTNIANIVNSNDKSNKNSAEQKSDNDNLAQNLKAQQEKLDKDKQKLEDERKALEAKKKDAAQTPKPADSRTATIIDPPTNIRLSPNGTILCVVRQRSTVNILGPTNVSDNNGTWYYTDACGRTGVIHSSQIRF